MKIERRTVDTNHRVYSCTLHYVLYTISIVMMYINTTINQFRKEVIISILRYIEAEFFKEKINIHNIIDCYLIGVTSHTDSVTSTDVPESERNIIATSSSILSSTAFTSVLFERFI